MDSGASFTAETMALYRVCESRRPPAVRLFSDPYAGAFLRPSLRVLAWASGVPVLRRLAAGIFDMLSGPGPRPSAIARTRVIDDAVTEAAAGIEQWVLLGAGYDTRAWRLAALAGRRVFEVDHPATQAAKRAVIGRLGLAGQPVTYVPVDFERDDLAARLDAAGFDRMSPAGFVWEGVTNYLTGDAVGATLAVIAGLAQAGGLLVVTYIDARALLEPSPFPEARRWVKAVARAGEPWTFGLNPAEAPTFFGSRGFQPRRDISTLEASRALPAMRARHQHGSALYRIAVLGIAGQSAAAPA
jgi:methyltransferase (TIGR00027 family)